NARVIPIEQRGRAVAAPSSGARCVALSCTADRTPPRTALAIAVRSRRNYSAQEGEGLRPAVLRGLTLVRRVSGRVLETVAHVRVAIKVVFDTVLGQFGVDLVDDFGRRVHVRVAKEADDGAADIAQPLHGSRSVISPRFFNATTVVNNRRAKIRQA